MCMIVDSGCVVLNCCDVRISLFLDHGYSHGMFISIAFLIFSGNIRRLPYS